MRDAKEHGLKVARENAAHQEPYLLPSEEPLEWDKSGVVRLDYALAAVHLIAARIVLRSVPGMMRQRIDKLIQKVGAALVAAVGRRVFHVTMHPILKVVLALAETMERAALERELESAIRRAVLRTMRDIPLVKLSQNKHRIRRRKSVFTRK